MAQSVTGNPILDPYILKNTDGGTLARGTQIFRANRVRFLSLDDTGEGEAKFQVQSDDSTAKYNVTLKGFTARSNKPGGTCSCPYNYGPICKHRIAAWLTLAPLLQAPPALQSMADTTALLPDLSDERLQQQVPDSSWKLRTTIKLIKFQRLQKGFVEAEVTYKQEYFPVTLTQLTGGKVKTSCSCSVYQYEPLCKHKLAVLLLLREQYGLNALDNLDRDYTAEKNALLADYGFSLGDDLAGKFQFKATPKGEIQLVVQDASLQKINQNWQSRSPVLARPTRLPTAPVLPIIPVADSRKTLVFVMVPNTGIPAMAVHGFLAKENLKTGKINTFREFRGVSFDELPIITESDQTLMAVCNRFTPENLVTQLRKENLITGYFYQLNAADLSPKAMAFAHEWTNHYLEQIWTNAADKRFFWTENTYSLSATSVTPIKLAPTRLRPQLVLTEVGNLVSLEVVFGINGEQIIYQKMPRRVGNWLFLRFDTLYKVASAADVLLLDQIGTSGRMRVRREFFGPFFQQFVVPLTHQFDVDIQLNYEKKDVALHFAEARLYLKEDDESLLFVPTFAYTEQPAEAATNEESGPAQTASLIEFANDGRSSQMDYVGDTLRVLHRNAAAEANITAFLQTLHPDFIAQGNGEFLYLSLDALTQKSWFLDFFEALKNRGIVVFGFKELKKFKFNPNKGQFQIRASSGIDWFDMKLELHFGDQFASLSEIKKAVLNRQNYVALKDGSMGMLPDDWLEKYGQMLKMGQVKGESLRLSKLHFSVIDQLYNEIDSEAIREEIAMKREKLLNFKKIRAVELPENVNATLRDYQLEGYKWLNFLDEFGWGGCLADDMGLGKTLQIITFIQAQKIKTPGAVMLVVVPTSLIFNWQAEVEKFCPNLRIHVHRGAGRAKNAGEFTNCDIVLTTYGMMRSDVEWLRDFRFQYVILDESQAIKNPNSLAAKAAKLLQPHNRLAMTGTPVENNTFDLYSQMDFLNPGLLGSQEFFRSEYATPIDKHQDKEKAAELRRLIKPFMLKRTKEEVAKDLPDKTETVLFCEMGKKQRKVYDTMRETYRQRIVNEMTLVGREKAAFLILEGLLKLRQICDSPALLSDDAGYDTESAKLDEIIREIEENASNHKILIFSQFLKMLDLIRQHLDQHHISYEYLDGQTQDRAERVNRFQNDKQCRVFLVSLKAGGVGLNLTEADYVYLVDPWWNPAVEQQAIDRTHRIGQTRKVFAYRMICKDTVEEKILELQARKKEVAADLISTEAGFIKKLTRDDIVGLFS